MASDLNFIYLYLAILGLIAILVTYKIIKYGSFKAAMFNSKIKATTGKVTDEQTKTGKRFLVIHELDESPEKAIGLEIVTKSLGMATRSPITLSRNESKKLAKLINDIVQKNNNL